MGQESTYVPLLVIVLVELVRDPVNCVLTITLVIYYIVHFDPNKTALTLFRHPYKLVRARLTFDTKQYSLAFGVKNTDESHVIQKYNM